LRQQGFDYLVNLSIGTPPQNLQAVFDTGSIDLIVNSASSEFCQSHPCNATGAFNEKASTTLTQVGTGMDDVYEATEYIGNWYTDTVSFGGKSVDKFVFGIADNSSDDPINTFGVSFKPTVDIEKGTSSPTNDSNLEQMVKGGIIPSAAYSIWMNSNKTLGGSVLLGGVDKSKFIGQLQSYPILTSTTGIYFANAINLTSASLGGSKNISGPASEFPAPVVLDTGNPNLLLPEGLVTNIWKAYDVQNVTIPGGATFGICNCSIANNNDATLDFEFPGLKISVPFSELVVLPTAELYALYGVSALPEGECIFMVSPTRTGVGNLLGDNFLRYAYYVVDLDSKQIALAASNPNPGASQILEIAAGGSPVPSLSASGAVPSQTGTGSTGSSTASSAQPTQSTQSGGNRLNGVSFGVVVGLVGLFFML
jgi:hypothetical protein